MYFSAKILSFILSLVCGLLAQKIWPHRKKIAELSKKRFVNFSLLGFNSVFLLVLGPLVALLPDHRPHFLEILGSLLLFDFLAYTLHRLYHQSDFLFRFHRVHHSDPSLETTTAFRFHILEVLPTLLVRIALANMLGISYLSLLIFEITFQAFNMFEHSNLQLPNFLSQKLSWLFITPALHRQHHSIVQIDRNSNYATIFSVWDHLFGSHQNQSETADFPMGLSANDQEQTPISALTMPFKP